jgi:hypothetical protein
MDCFAEPVIGRAFAHPLARNDGAWLRLVLAMHVMVGVRTTITY